MPSIVCMFQIAKWDTFIWRLHLVVQLTAFSPLEAGEWMFGDRYCLLSSPPSFVLVPGNGSGGITYLWISYPAYDDYRLY